MYWWRRKQREQDLERELSSDLDLEAAEQQEHELSEAEARCAAQRAFGNVALIKQDTRAMWEWRWVQEFRQDLEYALRLARREPGFATIAVLTLALGIGVNTAVFSVINTVLLQKPPLADPDRLVTLQQRFSRLGDIGLGAAPAEYLDYRDRNRVFSSVAGYEDALFDLTGGMEAVHVQAQAVTYTLFPTLGVQPLVGRTFSLTEDRPGGARVAVLSYELWQSRFGGSPQTPGSVIRLNEQPYSIIGIMPAGFEFPFTAASVGEPPALWVPIAFTAKRIQDRAAEFPVHIVARLKPGVSLVQAEQDARRVADDFERDHRDIYTGNLRLQVNVDPLGAREAARARPVLLALAGAVIFVLLTACANVTNLLLARAAVRQREMAVRNALGASAQRLIAQLVTEGLLLTTAAAVVGCALAHAVLRLVASLWPSFVAGLAQVRIDSTVLLFTLAISATCGLLCSLSPATTWTRPDIGASLKQAGRPGAAPDRYRLRAALVVVEAASAIVLLIGAGLLIHSLLEVLRVPIGFSPDGVLIARTTLNRQRYPSANRRHDAERQMVERLRAVPGVAAVGLTTHIPLADDRQIGFVLEGGDESSVRWADNALVSGEYFAAMGIPIVRGRTFGSQDTPQSPGSAIVNESMARRFWPNGDAIGKRIVWGGRKLSVVGIAGDVHIKALDSAVNPTIYCSVYQLESGATASAVFIVRAQTGDPTSMAAAVRAAIRSVDRGVPVFDIRTMDQVVSRSLASHHFAATLLSSFATLALALALIGLYGVLTYAVAQRTSELGVRLALGATAGEILRLVLADGLRLTIIGVVLGSVVGGVATHAMSRLLFGVQTLDPSAFSIAAAMLITVSLIASYVPAKRASRVDPIVALRQE